MNANKSRATTSKRYNGLGNPNTGQRPWNACVLDVRKKNGTYWYWDYNFLGIDNEPTLNFKNETAW